MWSSEWKEKEEKTHVAPIDVELIFLLDEGMSKRERETKARILNMVWCMQKAISSGEVEAEMIRIRVGLYNLYHKVIYIYRICTIFYIFELIKYGSFLFPSHII